MIYNRQPFLAILAVTKASGIDLCIRPAESCLWLHSDEWMSRCLLERTAAGRVAMAALGCARSHLQAIASTPELSGALGTMDAVVKAHCRATILSFTSWLVVGVHRQSHRSSIVDPLNVTPRMNLVRILCVVNAKCDTRSATVVSFRPPRNAMNVMDPHNQPKCKRQYCSMAGRSQPAITSWVCNMWYPTT
jgi:hypothetical protein